MRGPTLFLLALCVMPLAAACGDKSQDSSKADKDDDDDDAPKKTKKKAAPSASAAEATAAPSASEAAPVAGAGMVAIPSGALRAGSSCGAVPRATDEELVNPLIQMGDFSIDAYPYPNDPTQPPKLGTTKAEAEGLCQQAGKRLCSELEWERACKGANNTTFEYGNLYDPKACPAPNPLALGKRDKCKTATGVFDMHGTGFEWTSSPWGRGRADGYVTVRGYKGVAANVVRERCASGAGRDPAASQPDVGFRCCSGTPNSAVVDLPLTRLASIIEDASVPAETVTKLLKAMPADHQSVDGVTLSFDHLWRWHPRDNEELLVARWKGRPSRAAAFYEIDVFKVCNDVPTRVAGMRGPVEKTESLREDTTKEKVSIDLATKTDKGKVTLSYWYGSVSVTQPAWVKAGNKLETEEATPAKRPVIKMPTKLRPLKK